jgi:oligopeptide transport system substrate-binding protein
LDSSSRNLLVDVIGCEALYNAKGDAAAADAAKASFGVRALDDRTVEYQFTKPAPYFLVQASNWSAIPLRKDLVEAGGPKWWTNPATRIGNGPFRLVEYVDGPNPRVRYARNEHYWAGQTKLDELEFRFLDEGPAMEAYRQGDLDVIFSGDEQIPALEADPVLSRELVTIPDAGTFYYVFDLNREPFQDKQVRRAFATAFDRAKYCRERKFDTCTPTTSMIPPGMPGAIRSDDLAFNPEKARQELAASSYGGPAGLPEIDRYVVQDDPGSDVASRWLYDLFRQVLGVEMTMVPITQDDFDALYDDPTTWPQLDSGSWYAQPDPSGWLDRWRCDSPFNDHGYCDPKLDALLDRADAEMNPEQRIALYEEAGRMLVADAPAIFVGNVGTTWLVKPEVTGYTRVTGINGDWPGWMNLMTVDVERPA